MKNDTLFTVGVPVHNGMPYLPETIESLFAQTNPDFELLIINDGSSDGTREFLASLRDPRLRIVHQENHGLTATLNRMLCETRTPWLVRMDADDIARPNRVELLADTVRRLPRAAMVYTDAIHLGHPSLVSAARTTVGSPAELADIVRSGRLLSVVHSTVALQINHVRAVGGYRFDLHVEDMDLWWRLALNYPIVHIPGVTVEYRLSNNSICRNNLRKLSLNTLYVQYLLLSVLWQLSPLSYEQVCPRLQDLLQENRILYRERMWNAAIDLSNRRYLAAAGKTAAAALACPSKVAERVFHAFCAPDRFSLGIDPDRFRKMKSTLWPRGGQFSFLEFGRA